jgi:uncharacterized protein (DUF885 family)
MARQSAGLLFACLLVFTPCARVAGEGGTAEQLHQLFKEDWEWRLKEFPGSATRIGDNRYNDRLTDLSFEAIERRQAHEREMLARVQRIDRAKLGGQDAVSYDLFLRDKQMAVDGHRFKEELMPVTQIGGPQIYFPALLEAMPLKTAKDYENYVARLNAFPHYIDQTIALMRRGLQEKWAKPAVPLRSVPLQIAGQVVDDPKESALYKPFARPPAGIDESAFARLAESAQKAIAESVTPALKKFHAFIKDTYLPACTQEIAATKLPGGEAFYAYAVKRETTTMMSPQEIHEIGKREVERIRREMETVIRQVGFKGSFREFLTFLRTDPRFYYTKPADLIAGYSVIAKRADAELPKLFAELPRNTYGIRPFADYEAPAQTTGQYRWGAADGSRPGYYMVNTYRLDMRPKYEMEALSLHEAVPGHHLQIARAQELKGLPDFRRNGMYNAFVEGWALYAESLGAEMGFYTDPYSKFGQLTYEMWRACRLVVDTGMHAMNWTREQAITFMKENTAKTEQDIVVEIDRYIVWPGQALGYKLGELKIKELRARAKQELGDKFDVRKFHNAVLDDGPLPLDVLDQRINDWIAAQK